MFGSHVVSYEDEKKRFRTFCWLCIVAVPSMREHEQMFRVKRKSIIPKGASVEWHWQLLSLCAIRMAIAFLFVSCIIVQYFHFIAVTLNRVILDVYEHS